MPASGNIDDLYAYCLGWPLWHELGNWLALILSACFITKRSWYWLWRKPCGCDKRQTALNRLGQWLYSLTKSVPTVICRTCRVLGSYSRNFTCKPRSGC